MTRETLKHLQKMAEIYYGGKTITKDNLYERININSYLNCGTSLKVISEIEKEIGNKIDKIVLDTDYVYGNRSLTDYLNAMISTYLEWYVSNNCEKWGAVWDEDDLGPKNDPFIKGEGYTLVK